MTTQYRSLKIITTKVARDYVWEVTKLDGSKMENAESAEEYINEQDAIDDAKEFIDEWYKGE